MSVQQIDNRAPIGSLLKQPRLTKRKQYSNRGREHDENYLALIRKCPCASCGHDPCGIAAHVRTSSAAHGKPCTGMQMKPDDKWTVPLCHECHMRQHSLGELTFWYELGINAVLLCTKLQKAGGLEAMRTMIMRGAIRS